MVGDLRGGGGEVTHLAKHLYKSGEVGLGQDAVAASAGRLGEAPDLERTAYLPEGDL
jgi:hypothetical protein